MDYLGVANVVNKDADSLSTNSKLRLRVVSTLCILAQYRVLRELRLEEDDVMREETLSVEALQRVAVVGVGREADDAHWGYPEVHCCPQPFLEMAFEVYVIILLWRCQ